MGGLEARDGHARLARDRRIARWVAPRAVAESTQTPRKAFNQCSFRWTIAPALPSKRSHWHTGNGRGSGKGFLVPPWEASRSKTYKGADEQSSRRRPDRKRSGRFRSGGAPPRGASAKRPPEPAGGSAISRTRPTALPAASTANPSAGRPDLPSRCRPGALESVHREPHFYRARRHLWAACGVAVNRAPI